MERSENRIRTQSVKKAKTGKLYVARVGVRSFLKGETWRGIVRHKSLYLFVLPAVVLTCIFSYAPMFGLVIAFQDYNIADGVWGSEFIGFKMFRQILFSYDASYMVFRNTVYIALLRIATNFPMILLFALMVHEVKNKRLNRLIMTISYVPYFISWVAVSGMTFILFDRDGTLNRILAAFGADPINWYAEPDKWWGILSVSSLWKSMGWCTLIYMASLGTIDDELYDACRIDGGGRFRQALTVTIPGLMNVMIMQLILDIGSIMSDNYDQIRALTMGSEAVDKAVYVVGALEFSDTMHGTFTRGTCYGLIRGVIGLVLVILSNKLAKSTDNEGIL